MKPGLVVEPGSAYAGRVEVVDIGLGPHQPSPRARLLTDADVGALWPAPKRGDDKYSTGVVGVVAGSPAYPGAAVLSVGGALKAKSGLVRYVGTGRAAERHGALRPVVAAAMVRLAGDAPGSLLDPCCGTGTIVAEALGAGWDAHGCDIDPDAVKTAHDNVPTATIDRADALDLPYADASFDAV
ncbi:MAG: methyltransferase domain-containing protein, partial [Pseudonocardiaceae bacterium]|nr:methyltransferase domain-containing protein [Pseudonocardiaceae bacterium]